MKSKIDILNMLITIISFIAYYLTFYTSVFYGTTFNLWYFPGAIVFAIAIILASIGIIHGTKWLNILLLVLNAFFLLHFSSLLLLA